MSFFILSSNVFPEIRLRYAGTFIFVLYISNRHFVDNVLGFVSAVYVIICLIIPNNCFMIHNFACYRICLFPQIVSLRYPTILLALATCLTSFSMFPKLIIFIPRY
jgi:hypothetical protein